MSAPRLAKRTTNIRSCRGYSQVAVDIDTRECVGICRECGQRVRLLKSRYDTPKWPFAHKPPESSL